jgi:hypothetical protein
MGVLRPRPPVRLAFLGGACKGAVLKSSRTGWTTALRPLAPFQAGRDSRGSGLALPIPNCLTRSPNDGECWLRGERAGPLITVDDPMGKSPAVSGDGLLRPYDGLPSRSHLMPSLRGIPAALAGGRTGGARLSRVRISRRELRAASCCFLLSRRIVGILLRGGEACAFDAS